MLIDFEESRLSNGMRVATATMPHVESAAVGIWVGVGGRYEAPAVSGISHFIEHLLFKGTKTRSARDISQAIEGRGGYFNAFTQEESTCYYARISAEHLGSVVDILSDMYLNPRFAKEDIDKERGVIIEEIMMHQDQPQWLVQEMLGELLWVDHPLGRPLIGPVKNIRRVTRRELLRFKDTKYSPANTVVVMAGKVTHAAAVRLAERFLGGLSSRAVPAFRAVSRGTAQRGSAVKAKDIEQTHVAMGFRLFGRHDPRRYALKLMSIILGENMSSRLFQVVREKHGLAYSIHSSTQLFQETGVLDVQAGVDSGRVGKALDVIAAELARLKDRPVGGKELRRAKDYAIGQLRIGLESTSNQMMWVGENLTSYRKFIQPKDVVAKLESVTEKHIRDVARDALSARRFSVALIAAKAGDAHEKMLRSVASKLG